MFLSFVLPDGSAEGVNLEEVLTYRAYLAHGWVWIGPDGKVVQRDFSDTPSAGGNPLEFNIRAIRLDFKNGTAKVFFGEIAARLETYLEHSASAFCHPITEPYLPEHVAQKPENDQLVGSLKS